MGGKKDEIHKLILDLYDDVEIIQHLINDLSLSLYKLDYKYIHRGKK